LPDSPRYTGLNGEVENWMQWIDDSNSDDLLDLPDSDVDVSEFISGERLDFLRETALAVHHCHYEGTIHVIIQFYQFIGSTSPSTP